MADKNKVRYGISNLYVAFIESRDEDGIPTYGTPIKLPGAVSLSVEAEAEESVFWADNVKYFVTYSNNGSTIDAEVAKFPDEIIAEMLGHIIDAIGGLIEVTDGVQKQFALMGQLEGDVSARRFCHYCCSGSQPSADANTVEDTIEVDTETMAITTQPVQLTADGKLILKYALPLDESIPACVTAYNGFFSAVYKPTLPETA